MQTRTCLDSTTRSHLSLGTRLGISPRLLHTGICCPSSAADTLCITGAVALRGAAALTGPGTGHRVDKGLPAPPCACRNYCDDFQCESSPAVEQFVRSFARDTQRLRYGRSLFQPDVQYSVGSLQQQAPQAASFHVASCC